MSSQRERTVTPAHQRNGAERAAVVAPLADLEVAHGGRVAGVRAHAGMRRDGTSPISPARGAAARAGPSPTRRGRDPPRGARAASSSRCRSTMQPTATTALRDPSTFMRPGLDDRVDRLALGRVDEAARVDDDELGVVGVPAELGAVIDQLREVRSESTVFLSQPRVMTRDLHGSKLAAARGPLNRAVTSGRPSGVLHRHPRRPLPHALPLRIRHRPELSDARRRSAPRSIGPHGALRAMGRGPRARAHARPRCALVRRAVLPRAPRARPP